MNKLHDRLFEWFLALLLVFLGCGGPDFGGDIRVSDSQRHTLKSVAAEGKTLSLPADKGYNIHIKKSSQDPGSDGQARGDSDATAGGEAFCAAEAANGGSASAEFNIGHRIDNLTESGQAVKLEITYDLVQAMAADKLPASETVATTNLHIVVRDSRKKIIAKTALVQTNSDEAVAGGNTKDQRSLTVQFDPGLSYDVMLYGKVDAASSLGQKASARQDIKNLNMKCTFTPVAVQAEKK